MSYPLAFRRIAEAEYTRSIKWYEDRQEGLGIRFESAVETLLTSIAEDPEGYPIAHDPIREAKVHGFPYCIYYRIRSGRVVVLAVFHQSRDPSEWQSRA